ncbi:MAG TPA: PAS domain S-box protein [Bryobacteraceae bacterium]|nr:PAS domain S-box protein [Bryobacteraceae bacterium]
MSALQQAEQAGDFRAAFAEAPIACHQIDLEGRIISVNAAECALLELTEDQILGRPVWDFVAPEEREVSRQAVARKLAGTQALAPFERCYLRPDGARLSLEIHEIYARGPESSIIGIRSFLFDLTQRKRVGLALRESEARYRQIFEHASDIIYRADMSGRFTFFNASATRILGYTAEDLLGRKYLDLIRPDFRARAQNFYRQQLAARIPHTYFEFPAVARDGSEVWFGQNVELVEEEGKITGVQAVTRDITPRKRADEQLLLAHEELERRVRERTAQLELTNEFLRREMEERRQADQERQRLEAQVQHSQRLESLGVLAGGIAHDFNNLLASIMGYASLALMDLPEASDARNSIDHVLTAARSAADLTQQMLAYSGRGKFVLEPIDLSQLISGVVRLLETLISKKATLRLNLVPGLPPIKADAAQIRQVVMNLITNASDSLGDRNGVIEVTTGSLNAGPGELVPLQPGRILPGGLYVFLEVTDTGCGMDAETRARIFDPFFTTKFTGRGLGLAAVLGIMRGHQGAINVESNPNQGTRFRVLFPASEAPVPSIHNAPASIEDWRAAGTVLVVDDEPAVLELAKTILERAGLTVLTASDGQEAITIFTRYANRISAVLLDLTMPGMDGVEVFHQMAELRPEVKVILCSGYNEPDTSDTLGHKPAGFLRKPYHPGELLARLKALLELAA